MDNQGKQRLLSEIAELYGSIDYKDGLYPAPAQSSRLMKLIKGRRVGVTPQGEPSTVDLFASWFTGYKAAQRREEGLTYREFDKQVRNWYNQTRPMSGKPRPHLISGWYDEYLKGKDFTFIV